jgi:hypothetical protein
MARLDLWGHTVLCKERQYIQDRWPSREFDEETKDKIDKTWLRSRDENAVRNSHNENAEFSYNPSQSG